MPEKGLELTQHQNENTIFQNMRRLGVAGLAAGVAFFGANRASEVFAAESTPEPIPNALDISRDAQQRAMQENQGMTFLGPTEEDLIQNIGGAAAQSSADYVKKVSVSRSTRRAFDVRITQENARANVTVATFKDPNDTYNDHLRRSVLSFDGDIFTEKVVRITPMLRPETNGGRPRRWGRTVILSSWDNFSSDNIARQVGSETDYIDDDPRHVGTVRVTPRRLTREQINSGRFYIDVSQSCEPRNESYDVPGENLCDTEYGTSYRVKPGRRTTTYVTGRSTQRGDQLPHRRNVNR